MHSAKRREVIAIHSSDPVPRQTAEASTDGWQVDAKLSRAFAVCNGIFGRGSPQASPGTAVLRLAVSGSGGTLGGIEPGRPFGGDPEGAQEARQTGRVSQRQVCELAGPEPAKIVVFVRCGVDRFPVPAADEERVQVEGGITDRHREGYGVVDVNPEFFDTFPADGLVRRLECFDMPADEVPAVGIPATRRMAMHQQHATVAHQCGD
jgi:hypothetical protein